MHNASAAALHEQRGQAEVFHHFGQNLGFSSFHNNFINHFIYYWKTTPIDAVLPPWGNLPICLQALGQESPCPKHLAYGR